MRGDTAGAGDPRDALMERIDECVLNPGGRLYDEPRFVLSGEVSETTTFFSLLHAIAAGNRQPTHIAGKLGLSTSYLSSYTRILLDLEVLDKRLPGHRRPATEPPLAVLHRRQLF